MDKQQQLPEDIRGKIREHCRYMGFESDARDVAAFGYHLRDEQVEQLKAELYLAKSESGLRMQTIEQQTATISELLQELQNIKDNPNARRNTFRQEIGQLLQKHKP